MRSNLPQKRLFARKITGHASARSIVAVVTSHSGRPTDPYPSQPPRLARIFHSWIEQRSGECVRRLDITQPNEYATHRFFDYRL